MMNKATLEAAASLMRAYDECAATAARIAQAPTLAAGVPSRKGFPAPPLDNATLLKDGPALAAVKAALAGHYAAELAGIADKLRALGVDPTAGDAP